MSNASQRLISISACLFLASCASLALCGDAIGPRRHAAIARLEGKIVFDGKLDDAAWAKAPEHTGFAMPLGLANRKEIPSEAQTFFRALYDDDRLYFGIRCNEPKMADMVVEAARQHDAAMWSDDDVEVFLDPVGDRTEYYQLCVNSEGTQVDLYFIESGNTGKGGWSSEWETAVHKGKDFWSVEIAIPFGLFHNRPSSMWTDDWVFSISRTRRPAPAYHSQFSPANRYNDVANFGTLGPIKIPKDRYNLYAESPQVRLEPTDLGFNILASVMLENRSDQPFDGELAMNILAPKAKGGSVPILLPPKSGKRVEIAGGFVAQQGKLPVIFRAQTKHPCTPLRIRFDQWFTYTPLTLRLTQPNYRNNIYASQVVDVIRGVAGIGMPLERVKGNTLRVTLTSRRWYDAPRRWYDAPSLLAPISTDTPVEGTEVFFDIPAANLPIGDYRVRAELLRQSARAAKDGPSFELVADKEIPLRKLPSAPAVEVRVDDQGNLLIAGLPVFIRGWYGSLSYCVGPSSFPSAQLPRSTNFIMGASDHEQTDLGLYTLAGVTRVIDEAKAKLDQPIDDALKTKLRAEIAKVRLRRNVIGYYISDEPECRGLSPVFLKSLYEFMAEEDPYRFCKIVSRSPVEYIGACDVICPHPYMNPQLYEDGARKFGTTLRHIHNVITAAAGANDGSKAVWSMPQTFTYGGLRGQHPTFAESRWFVHTSIACNAKGIVPFIFSGYWNHLENRVALNYILEELALLAPAWIARDTATQAAADNPDVDVIAKSYKPDKAAHSHVFIVAANQSYGPSKASFTVPVLAQNKNTRLLVLRENRIVPVADGRFSDEFHGLGAHVYTTLEVLPDLRTLDEIRDEITHLLNRPGKEGNLLARQSVWRVKWTIGEPGQAFASDIELADGRTDAAAWFPVYGDRTQCVIVFEKPVSFSRIELYTPTIAAADLDVWDNGQWKTVHQWKDQYLPKMVYRGNPQTTTKIRIRPIQARKGYGSWLVHEISELAVFAPPGGGE